MSTNPGPHWETTLQSWTPRRPSESLKGRIFGGVSKPALAGGTGLGEQEPEIRLAFNWRWLMPMTAAFMGLLLIVGRQGEALSGIAPEMVPTLAFSQPDLSTYFAASTHTTHNAWNDASFASTSSRPALSTPLSFTGTNSTRP